MNAKDWFKFIDRKPGMGQPILALSERGAVSRFAYYPEIDAQWTHWQPWAEPEKPDPFIVWYKQNWPDDPHRRAIASEAWMAALEWRRKNPE